MTTTTTQPQRSPDSGDPGSSTMKPIGDLVDRLARRHEGRVWYEDDGQPATRITLIEPLLAELRAAIHSNTGQTHSGHSAVNERNAFNLRAFALYEDIDGRIASMFASATDAKPTQSPEDNLTGWFDALRIAYAEGEIVEAQLALAWERLTDMVERIVDMFDPPVTKEILGPCPKCGERYATNRDEDTRVSAVYAQYRRGGHVEAVCRRCAAHWAGETQLLELARGVDAAPDFEALHKIRSGG